MGFDYGKLFIEISGNYDYYHGNSNNINGNDMHYQKY